MSARLRGRSGRGPASSDLDDCDGRAPGRHAYAVNTAAVAATGARAAHGVAARSGLQLPGGPILVFRVDVSRYPQVGVVVTVPGSQERLTSSEFVVLNGAQSASPTVRQLSANNVQLMLVPDTGLGSSPVARGAASRGAFPGRPARWCADRRRGSGPAGLAGPGLTRDATASVARLAGLPAGILSPAARLAAALSGFSPGSGSGARRSWSSRRRRRSPGPRRPTSASSSRPAVPRCMSSTPRRAETLPTTLWPRERGPGHPGAVAAGGHARSAGSSATSASSITCASPTPTRCPGG